MGESWKANHANNLEVLDALQTAVKNTPVTEEHYKGPERRETTRSRWRFALFSFEKQERADK